ncbi:GumC domain-containing protein [Chitinophaga rhizosphaerae]|uniref:lipopolysaccharide biosynthesis protein n=1 Tax=Chitinophaga rhizosphaerae TaxID=1864947 RepID=UPI000F801F05|nr:lipopolysaccharide biosynthesis protein [Chitinophaga rhizosphaerae]
MESINNPGSRSVNEELSLKDLFLKIKDWFSYLLSKWVLILIVGLAGGALGLTYSLFSKTQYVAELTFTLEDGKSNPFAAYAGLASQFGIDLGGNSSGLFSGDNILEFMKSRLLIQKTLLSPVGDSGKKQSLANMYIDVYELRDAWKSNEQIRDIQFPTNTDRSKFTLQQDSVLNIIYEGILKHRLKIARPDKKLNFIVVQTTTPSEMFSKLFTERLVDEAIDFYIQTKTQRSSANVDKLQGIADSLGILLNKKTASVAATQDINTNPARSMAMVPTELATRDKIMLQTMYLEVVKNLEITKIAMNQETPIIQIVDTPILPLEEDKVGKVKGIAIGGFLAGFLVVLFLVIRKSLRDIIS